jgi:hypothetical protein
MDMFLYAIETDVSFFPSDTITAPDLEYSKTELLTFNKKDKFIFFYNCLFTDITNSFLHVIFIKGFYYFCYKIIQYTVEENLFYESAGYYG